MEWLKENWTGPFTLILLGAVCCGVLLTAFIRLRLPRHLIVAGIAAVTPIVLIATRIQTWAACSWLGIAVGISLLVSGGIAFTTIVRLPILTEGDPE